MAHRQRETTAKPKVQQFFSTVIKNDHPADWNAFKQHINKIWDNLSFTANLVLKQLTEVETTKSEGPGSLNSWILYETRNDVASSLISIFRA